MPIRLATSSADSPEPRPNAFSRLPTSSKRSGKDLLLSCGANLSDDLRRCDRGARDPYTERLQSVLDGRNDGGCCRHDAAFANPFDAEGIEGRGRFQVQHLDVRCFGRADKKVV